MCSFTCLPPRVSRLRRCLWNVTCTQNTKGEIVKLLFFLRFWSRHIMEHLWAMGRGKRRGWISSGRVGGSRTADVTVEREKRQGRKHRQRGFFYILQCIKINKTRNIYFDEIQLCNLSFRRAEWPLKMKNTPGRRRQGTSAARYIYIYIHATTWGTVNDQHTNTRNIL